ncbi:MAG TPA: biotin transporter BioY [Gemmatimonadota bacterium]|nr:biotin transporter BioY [Gemmatimonadota bacterium]
MQSPVLSVVAPALSRVDVRPVERAAGILAFALLTALGAFVRIPLPFTPVPITLQTFFVLAAGIYLGSRDAALSQLGYLALGAVGLPVFAGGGAGMGHFLGVTGGYLVAFPLAAAFVGAALRPGDSVARATAVCTAATLLILALGAAGVAAFLGVGTERAIALGVLPFLPGGAVKIAAAVSLVARAPLAR